MGLIAIPNVFAQRTTAKASEVNANFSEVASKFNATAVLTDVARTITVLHTFGAGLTVSAGTTALQALTATTGNFAGAVTVAADLTVSDGADATTTVTLGSGGAAPTAQREVHLFLDAPSSGSFAGGTYVGFRRNGSVTWLTGTDSAVTGQKAATDDYFWFNGSAGGYVASLTRAGQLRLAAGLVVSAGGITVTGGIAGTLSTAAQPNITSVGVLASTHLTSPVVDSGGLTVSAGGATMTGIVNVTGRIVVSAHGMFGAWDGTGDAGSLCVSNNTTTTATAGAQSLPASPAGFLSWKLGAASIKVPYYNA